MSGVFQVHQGDLLPVISSTLKDGNGVALDLTGATVRFAMRPLSGVSLSVDAVATIVDENAGVVKYEWQAGDTDTEGVSLAEWRVTYPGPKLLTVPNDQPIVITASPRLANMPTISPADLATIRAAVGADTPPTDVDLAILLGVMGTPALVSAHILEGRLLGPQKIKLDGDLELDYGDRRPLAAAIGRLRSATGDGLSQGLLYRTDRER